MVSTKNPIINAHVSCPPHACHLAKLIIFAQKNRKCSIDSAKVTVCSVRFRSYKDSCHLPVAMQAICAWLRNDLRVHDNAVLHEAKLVVDWKVCQLWKPSRVGITIQNELDLPKSVSFVCHVNTYAGNSWLVYSYLYVQMCFWPIKWNPSNQGRSSSYNQYSVRLQQQRSIFLKAARLSAQRKVPVLPVYVWKPRRAEAPMFFLLKPQMDQRIQLGGFIDFWMVSIDRWLVNFYISISWFAVMVSLIFLWGMLVTYTLNCCWILFSFWIWRFLSCIFSCESWASAISCQLSWSKIDCRHVLWMFWQCFRSLTLDILSAQSTRLCAQVRHDADFDLSWFILLTDACR